MNKFNPDYNVFQEAIKRIVWEVRIQNSKDKFPHNGEKIFIKMKQAQSCTISERRDSVKYLIILVVAFIMIIFFQNAVRVNVQLLIWKIPDVPLILVMMASVFLGMMLAFLIDGWQRYRKNRSGFFNQ